MATTLLLGPQRRQPTLAAVLSSLGIAGPVATVTAGWQEREGEVDELAAHLAAVGCRALDLTLHARAERAFAADPELAAAHRARQDRLKQLRELYRTGLGHALAGARALLGRPGDPRLLEPLRAAAVAAVRALDEEHITQVRTIHREHAEALRPAERPAVATEREELAELVDGSAALAIAGGHAAILLNRLELFGLLDLAAGKPLVAWSAGAMVLGRRVVLFHDRPPQGAGDAEVLEAGLGLVDGVVALPHADRRLALGDRRRVALMARRFAPDLPVALDGGCRLAFEDGRLRAAEGARRLTPEGAVEALVPPPREAG